MIKAIILDWHGVLDLTTFNSSISKIAKEIGVNAKEVINLFIEKKKELIISNDSDQIFWNILNLRYRLTSDQKNNILLYRNELHLNQKLLDKLEELSSKYSLAILSDCPSYKAKIIHSSVNLNIFKAVSFSCELGVTKTDPDFFYQISNLLNVSPTDTLYIDDNQPPILTAQKLGYRTHLYVGNDDFINEVGSI